MRQTAKLNMMNTLQLCIGKKIANKNIKEFQTNIEQYYMLINIIFKLLKQSLFSYTIPYQTFVSSFQDDHNNS